MTWAPRQNGYGMPGGLLGYDPAQMALLTTGLGLLGSSGPSTQPVNLGPVLAGGMLNYQQGLLQAQDWQTQQQEMARQQQQDALRERMFGLQERELEASLAQQQREAQSRDSLMTMLQTPPVVDGRPTPSAGLLGNIDPQTRQVAGLLAGYDPEAAIKMLMPQAPEAPNYQQFGGDVYQTNAAGGLQRVLDLPDAQPAPDNTLVQVFDPNSPTGYSYAPRAEAAGAPAPARAGGVQITGYDDQGRPLISVGGAASQGAGLQRPTQTQLEGDLISFSTQAEQANTIARGFRPEWQETGLRLKMLFAAGKNKLGVPLEPADEAQLTEFANYRANASNLLTSQLKAMSGAAVTPQEAERLLKFIPNPGTGIFDGDSPVEFKAKLDNYQSALRRATARLFHIRRNGLDEKSFGGLGLEQMDGIIDARGDEIEAEIKKANPQADANTIRATVLRQLGAEFGVTF